MPLGHLYEEDPISYNIASKCPGYNPSYPKYPNPGQYNQESGKSEQLSKEKTTYWRESWDDTDVGSTAL